MFFLPLAQVRQAVTGDWRCFYELRLLRKILKEAWMACLFLALLYTVLFFPVILLKTLPGFFSNLNPALVEATPQEVRSILNRYFFASALLVFPAFVFLRLAAARIYASALLRALRRGSIGAGELGAGERSFLSRLDLLDAEATRRPVGPAGALSAALKTVARTLAKVLTAALWFGFVALVFIGQFFTNQGAIGWLNQPLVQLPWFRYLPVTVRNVWGEVLVSLLLVTVLAILIKTWASLKRLVVTPS